MLTVTPRASDVIRGMLVAHPEGGIRLAPVDRIEAGRTIEIGMAVAPEPAPSDQVVGPDGAKVFVDEDVVDVLANRTLDVDSAADDGTAVFRLLRAD